MSSLVERVLRNFIRQILTENVYDKERFSPDLLSKSISDYTAGNFAALGMHPDLARDIALDDLRVTFGEMGYDMDASLQSAVNNGLNDEVESIVRQLLDTEFVSSLAQVRGMNISSLNDILLPGDVEELVNIIVDDMLDGDGSVTIN